MSQKEELPFGLVRKPRVQSTLAVHAELDDHLGKSYVYAQTWWSGEGFSLEIQNSDETHKADITWTQYEALKVAVDEIQKAETAEIQKKKFELKTEAQPNAVFNDTTIEILADTNMLELHDNNGPGSIVCPVCGASIAMKWSNGVQLTSSLDMKHAEYCPVIVAKKHLQQKKTETLTKLPVRRRVRALKGKP